MVDLKNQFLKVLNMKPINGKTYEEFIAKFESAEQEIKQDFEMQVGQDFDYQAYLNREAEVIAEELCKVYPAYAFDYNLKPILDKALLLNNKNYDSSVYFRICDYFPKALRFWSSEGGCLPSLKEWNSIQECAPALGWIDLHPALRQKGFIYLLGRALKRKGKLYLRISNISNESFANHLYIKSQQENSSWELLDPTKNGELPYFSTFALNLKTAF